MQVQTYYILYFKYMHFVVGELYLNKSIFSRPVNINFHYFIFEFLNY